MGLFDHIEQAAPEEASSGPQAVERTGAPAKSQRKDVFMWLNALWNKSVPEGTPPTFLMHAFLAADPDMAQMARVLQSEVREPMLVFRIWQGLLPKGPAAPRWISYVKARKPPAEEKLVARMKETLAERREVCEQMLEIFKAAGRDTALYHYYGVEAP